MHCCTIIRTAALLLLLSQSPAAQAQPTADSPYSAYGFGDLLSNGQATQALMGGMSLGITEPFAVLLGNPASYASLVRPVFETGVAFRSTRSTSSTASTTLNDANFTGFDIGVPFARGKWGLAMGLMPYSDVGYSTSRTNPFDGGNVKYAYTGSGGLDRAFFGLGHTIYQHPTDSLGNTGMRVMVGADMNFIFGSIEQTREAIYPANTGYTNIRAFSSLVLRSPTADASVMWQGDLTRKVKKGGDNWRWSVGASVAMPARFRARYSNQVTTFVSSSGLETVRDTIPEAQGVKGKVELPMELGVGIGVQNARWAFMAEMKQQDWRNTEVDVPGYAMATSFRNSTTFGAAVRFKPAMEGNLLQRAVYRIGIQHAGAPLEIRAQELATNTATLGVSLPLNAAQTNSWFNFGAVLGQRGSTDEGLIKERYATVWIGVTFTPWRGERWFMAPKIQ